jgi:hypothetical protein
MKFKAEIEIHHEHLKVLLDYHNGHELKDERLEIEMYKKGLITEYRGTLIPTPLGSFILELYLKQRPKNPSTYEKMMEKMELEGKVKTVNLPIQEVVPEPPQTYGITNDDGIFPSENDVYLK